MKRSRTIATVPEWPRPATIGRPPRSRRGARPGFSLIELLAVVTIIGLLLAITIPAAQRVREAARRAECINHLKQIGLAIQNYEGIHGRFPPINQESLVRDSHGLEMVFANHSSPLARTLGQLEQTVAYNAINFQFMPISGLGLQANYTVMMTSVGGFLCPSDSIPPVAGYGRVNYRFCTGPTTYHTPITPEPESGCGPFGTAIRCFGPADVTDGLSNTVGVSERLQGDWTKVTFKPGGDYPLADHYNQYLTADAMVALCRSLSPPLETPHESKGGETWMLSGYHFTDYNHCATPNRNPSTCGTNNWTKSLQDRYFQPGSFPATSAHPGGVNVLMMDGNVRFVRDGISLAHWRALSTHAGGEIASPEE